LKKRGFFNTFGLDRDAGEAHHDLVQARGHLIALAKALSNPPAEGMAEWLCGLKRFAEHAAESCEAHLWHGHPGFEDVTMAPPGRGMKVVLIDPGQQDPLDH
jgi:hypothetical protein